MRVFMIAAAMLLMPLQANAMKMVAPNFNNPPCVNGMMKNASISINFNGQEKSLDAARAAFDTQKKTMEAEIAKLGNDQIRLSNYNYNVSMNHNYNGYGSANDTYNFSGNLSYQVMSEELAQKLCARLAEMKQQFNMSVNANMCQQ